MAEEILYTLREAGERLGVSIRTVYRWIDEGKLRSVKIGRHRRIPANALEEFSAAVQETENRPQERTPRATRQEFPWGEYVAVTDGDARGRAFIPNPLPPELDLDRELVQILSDADRAVGELAGLGRTLPNPNLLIRPFVRREAVLSSRIEGTQTGVSELYEYESQGVLPGVPLPESKSDVREVYNYVRALEYGLERLPTFPISLRLVRDLHERLMEGVRGEKATPGKFRRIQNWIGPLGCKLDAATFVPPPVPEMLQGLGALEKYLHAVGDYPPLVRLGFIHYQFEALHPFKDGNGRMGRLLLVLLLVAWELLPQPLLYLSAFFERRRDEYYDYLDRVSSRGEWKGWTSFFLRGVTTQAQDAVARAKRLQDLKKGWEKALEGRKITSVIPFKLIDALFESPILTIPRAQRLLGGKSYQGTQRGIENLIKIGALTLRRGGSYGKAYASPDILRIVGEEDE